MLISSYYIAYRTIKLKLYQESSPYTIRTAYSPLLSFNTLRNRLIRCSIKGFIRELTSPTVALLLLAAKLEEGVRIYYNYRGLNNVTVKNRYPLPLIHKTLNTLYGAKFYIKLNIIAAFNRIRIAEGYKQLIVFITRFRLYKILVTLFGLYNTLAIFQNYINYILYNILDDYYIVYLNNILIFSKTRAKYTRYVKEVICRLRTAGL